MMDKKAWEKPELIILARNRPEEQVLTQCKGGSSTNSTLSHDEGGHSDYDCVSECRDTVVS
jgi:hypothetical protein